MAYTAGQRVTIFGRLGNVLFDNSANVAVNTNPALFVAFADSTYTQVPVNSVVNVVGGWLSGIGPGQ
jgi:hypothetical protein